MARPASKNCDDCGKSFKVAKRGRIPARCPACRSARASAQSAQSAERARKDGRADELAAEKTRIANEVAERLTDRLRELERIPASDRAERLARAVADREYGTPKRRV